MFFRKNILLSLLILSFLTAFAFAPPASATSDYGMRIAYSLKFGGDSQAGYCPTQSMTNQWSELMNNSTTAPWSYKNTWNYQSNYNNARQKLDSFYDLFQQKLSSGSGWGVSIVPGSEVGHGAGNSQVIRVILFNQNDNVTMGQNSLTFDNYARVTSFMTNPNAGCRFQTWETNDYLLTLPVNDSFPVYFLATDNVVYPSDYSGNPLPSTNTHADLDDDGLNASQETVQGTSNSQKDTDGDGLNDLIESQWYPQRDDVFCGTSCAYPDPLAKDLYIEIDWMKDSSNRTLKPSPSQIGFVENMFENNDINLHVDTGQFGGGNELSTYTQTLPRTTTTGQIDFLDYKNGNSNESISANFSQDRNLIWRYMIYGYNYAESTGSSGWSETMGDDLFISGGLIEDMSGLVNTDRAIANTIAHELGHTVCLSAERIYIEQPNECMFFGIDNDDDIALLEDYFSVMNYRYQLTDIDDMGVVDYSDGSNGSNDHDDWTGVQLGMDGFTGTRTLYGASIKNKYDISPDGSAIIEEAPIQEVRENYKQSSAGSFSNVKNDPHLPQTASVSSKDDSREHKAQLQEKEQPSILDPLLVGGGAAVLLSLTLGSIWAIRRLKS